MTHPKRSGWPDCSSWAHGCSILPEEHDRFFRHSLVGDRLEQRRIIKLRTKVSSWTSFHPLLPVKVLHTTQLSYIIVIQTTELLSPIDSVPHFFEVHIVGPNLWYCTHPICIHTGPLHPHVYPHLHPSLLIYSRSIQCGFIYFPFDSTGKPIMIEKLVLNGAWTGDLSIVSPTRLQLCHQSTQKPPLYTAVLGSKRGNYMCNNGLTHV